MNILWYALLGTGVYLFTKRETVVPIVNDIIDNVIDVIPDVILPGPDPVVVIDGPIIPSGSGVGDWPNEPGLPIISEVNFDYLPKDGWYADPPHNNLTFENGVMQWEFAPGLEAGTSGTPPFIIMNGEREVYTGFRIMFGGDMELKDGGQKVDFRMSNGIDGHDVWLMGLILYAREGGMKTHIYFPSDVDNAQVATSYGDSPGTRQIRGNFSDPFIELNTWYTFEVYTRQSSSRTSRDGILRWWINGTLCGDHRNVNYPQAPLIQYEFAGTWLSNPLYEGYKTGYSYYWIDSAIVTGR